MAKKQTEDKKRITGKLEASVYVTNFDGAQVVPVIEEVRHVVLYDGEDVQEAAKRVVTEIAEQPTVVPSDDA